MSKLSLQDQITKLSEPLLDSLGLELWGLEYLPSTGRALLRIYIERKPADIECETASAVADSGADAVDTRAGTSGDEIFPVGAGIDECTEASRLIGLNLEVEDIIPSAYILEVSTPGLDRRFFKPAQLAAAQGELVDVQLEQPLDSHPFRKKFIGELKTAEVVSGDAGVEAGGSWSFALELREPAPEEEPMLCFAWQDVKKARLVYIAPVKEKPGKKSGPQNAGAGDKQKSAGTGKQKGADGAQQAPKKSGRAKKQARPGRLADELD